VNEVVGGRPDTGASLDRAVVVAWTLLGLGVVAVMVARRRSTPARVAA
jgi:hypothetical protein